MLVNPRRSLNFKLTELNTPVSGNARARFIAGGAVTT